MSDLRPTDGARFLLERTSGSTYRVAIYTPDVVFESTAVLHDDGSVDLVPTGAPTELDDMLATVAKLIARGAAKRRDDGLPPWPARVLRWRGPGR